MSSEAARNPRKFLVVVDKTPESKIAIRFATRRAQSTGGRVTLMCVAQAADFQQWRGVEEIMRDEAHQEAEALIYDAAKTVNELSGIVSELVIGEGRPMDVLMDLLKGDHDLSVGQPISRRGRPSRRHRPLPPHQDHC